jgi:type I restriction enzyme S subunit
VKIVTSQLRRFATSIKDGTHGTFPRVRDGVPLLSAKNIVNGNIVVSEAESLISEADYRAIHRSGYLMRGDVLLTIVGTIGGTAIFDLPCPVAFQRSVASIRPSATYDNRYLRYVLESTFFQDQLRAATRQSAQGGIYLGDIAETRIPVLPTDSQRAIADYLDDGTARIDALIAKKRKMIELLAERFEAAIFRGISCGMAGARPLKRSGLSWIEEIPSDWGTPTISANFDLQLGKMLNAEASSGSDHFPYLRNANVQWDHLELDDLSTMHFTAADRRRCELRPGDLLVCEGGEVGRAAMWNGELTNCYFQKALHRVRARRKANSRYLMYCLRAAAKSSVFAVEGNLSTIAHLTGEQLRVHRFPWPPEDEQQVIVERLDDAAQCTTRAVDALSQQIRLLVEHRQALITAAVTGEFEASGVAA